MVYSRKAQPVLQAVRILQMIATILVLFFARLAGIVTFPRFTHDTPRKVNRTFDV